MTLSSYPHASLEKTESKSSESGPSTEKETGIVHDRRNPCRTAVLAQPASTVPVCFWRPPWSRVRASGDLGHSIRVSEVGQSQVNDGRSFLCVCGVFFLWSIFVMSLWSPHTERNTLASLGRCPPSRSIETPFSSAALRCATQNEAFILVRRLCLWNTPVRMRDMWYVEPAE